MTAPVDGMTDDARAAVDELLSLLGRQITLTPGTGVVTEKPGGGKDYAPAASRDPQTFALFNTTKLDGREDAQTDRGLSRKFEFKLVGYWDAVIAVGDTWEDDIGTYTVDSIDRTKPYQIKAMVTGFLKETGHSFG